MNLSQLENLSPTLLGGMLQDHKCRISKGSQIFNSKDCSLDAWFKDETTGRSIRLQFNELPEELRRAIHDYTTRLCSEKLLIEAAIENVNITPSTIEA